MAVLKVLLKLLDAIVIYFFRRNQLDLAFYALDIDQLTIKLYVLNQLNDGIHVLIKPAARRTSAIERFTIQTVGFAVLVPKCILAELTDEHDFIEDVHDDAVGSLGYLQMALAVRTCRFVIFPVVDANVAIELFAALHLGDRLL